MRQFAFYHHVGSGNKGCEALVRSTSDLLCHRDKQDIRLYSMRPQEDEKSGYENISHITGVYFDTAHLKKPLNTADKVRLKLLRMRSAYAADEYYFSKFLDQLPLDEDRVYLSIGGDTYCYGDNSNMHAFNAALKKRGKKTVLWGCSLDETSFSPYNAADLRTFDAIFARETGTYDLLREKGFHKNVFLHPDPAFTLRPEYLPLPEGFQQGNTIGINASPLVFKYESGQKGIGLRSYEKLIEYILSETDCSVLLIPHVFWDFSDDRTVLRALFEKYADTGRVVFLDREYTANQLKGFIARCRLFVGARTHATIAAYSTMVPTLVLGYSVKSVNIALDLFGRTDGYVVPIDKLEDERGLADAVSDMLQKEGAYQALLSERVPDYIARAHKAADTLFDVLDA
ncbi:MAG: polysaccharide pyruvyl transferase family protein [Oscillospiraceae bacterium]|nr:polysaccharide pyruvyl transferase family protein [Oscillospiraceae bacterium]